MIYCWSTTLKGWFELWVVTWYPGPVEAVCVWLGEACRAPPHLPAMIYLKSHKSKSYKLTEHSNILYLCKIKLSSSLSPPSSSLPPPISLIKGYVIIVLDSRLAKSGYQLHCQVQYVFCSGIWADCQLHILDRGPLKGHIFFLCHLFALCWNMKSLLFAS